MNPFISTENIYRKLFRMGFGLVVLVLGAYLLVGRGVNPDNLAILKPQYLRASAVGLDYNIRNIFNNQAAFDNQPARSIPVLTYHSILEKTDEHNVSFKNFSDQMLTLKRAGWETVTLEDLFAFVRGERILPDKSFVITFDDGRRDSYYPVDPILRSLGYEAAMAVIVDRMKTQTTYHLDISELQKMYNSGRWQIISHGDKDHDLYPIDANDTLGHFMTDKIWLSDQNRLETEEEYRNRVQKDLEVSKQVLEKTFDTSVRSYAPPFGDFGQASQNNTDPREFVLKSIADEYDFGFYQLWLGGGYAFNYPKEELNFHVPGYPEDLGMIKRITVLSDWTGNDLLEVLNMSHAKNPSDISSTPQQGDGWRNGWGILAFAEDEGMRMGADPTKTGGSVYLDGSYDWKNYEFKATLNWLKGTNVFLVARYQNDANYVACSYGRENIQIKQFLNGEPRVIAGVKHAGNLPHQNGTYAIRVQDRNVECIIDGRPVLATKFLESELNFGGVGFKTWDPAFNNSEIVVKKISISAL